MRKARRGNVHSAVKVFQNPSVLPGCEILQEDPNRPTLFRLWLARNCAFMNNYSPIILLGLLGNIDAQAITSKCGVMQYITKYITKLEGAGGGTFRSCEQAFDHALAAAEDRGGTLTTAVGKFFNQLVSPKMICQHEVMHHLWKLPVSLCNRWFRVLNVKQGCRRLKSAREVTVDATGFPDRDTSLTHP